jgi:hypothetical protein
LTKASSLGSLPAVAAGLGRLSCPRVRKPSANSRNAKILRIYP